MKLTLVRMIETKEPVMAIDRIDDLVYLGATVDMIVDPASCEYLDIDIKMPIQILYSSNLQWKNLTTEEKDDSFCNANIGDEMAEALSKAFKSKRRWIQFPENFDFVSADRECRIIEPDDLF